jgi:aldehyde dehydrogenase (NAD+)
MNTAVSANVTEQVSSIAGQVAAIRAYFKTGVTRPIEWRKTQLTALKQLILENQSSIGEALEADLAKSEEETWISEIGYSLADIDHTLKKLAGWMKPRRVSTPLVAFPASSYMLPEPLGTICIIGAWNYPFQLVMGPFTAAIAAGNCAVLKPSELSIHTSNLIAELLPKYLDAKAFQVIEGEVAETTELLKQPFEHIFYTGGEGVGKVVMRAAAEQLTPVTLEMGGKSPCIVDNSSDLDVAAARIVWSKFMNAGQTCVAPDYVLVQSSVYAPLLEALKKKIVAFYGEDAKNSRDYGRIVNERHFQRILSYLTDQTIAHGGASDLESRYIAPTLVEKPSLDSPIMQNEIFGPLLPILTYDSIDEAIALVNKREKPLALYVFTQNSQLEKQVLSQTSAGSVCVNDGMMFMLNPELPFGGVGNSGMGRYHGKFGFDGLSHLKTVMKRSFKFDVPLRYPPFNAFKFNLLKKLL